MVAREAVEVPRVMISPVDIALRSGFLGTTISQPGSTVAEAPFATEPFIYTTYTLDCFASLL